MTTAAFNQVVSTNGGIGNLLYVRSTGIGVVYLAGAWCRTIAIENGSNIYFVLKDDKLLVYKFASTPQGPQIETCQSIPIEEVYEMTFFYVPEIHDDDQSPDILVVYTDPELPPPVVIEDPPLPDIATIPLQAACMTGFVNAINLGSYVGPSGAKSFMNPNTPTYNLVTEDYLRNVVFPGSPVNPMTNLKIYEHFATVSFIGGLVVFALMIDDGVCYIESIGRLP